MHQALYLVPPPHLLPWWHDPNKCLQSPAHLQNWPNTMRNLFPKPKRYWASISHMKHRTHSDAYRIWWRSRHSGKESLPNALDPYSKCHVGFLFHWSYPIALLLFSCQLVFLACVLTSTLACLSKFSPAQGVSVLAGTIQKSLSLLGPNPVKARSSGWQDSLMRTWMAFGAHHLRGTGTPTMGWPPWKLLDLCPHSRIISQRQSRDCLPLIPTSEDKQLPSKKNVKKINLF